MQVYLAGDNGKLKILSALKGGIPDIDAYIHNDYKEINSEAVSCRDGLVEISHLDNYKGGDYP